MPSPYFFIFQDACSCRQCNRPSEEREEERDGGRKEKERNREMENM
jgi:hypothetical protein